MIKLYNSQLTAKPLATKVCTTFGIMSAGDIICQGIEQLYSGQTQFNLDY